MRNRAATVSKSTLTPSPVTADTTTACGCRASRPFTSPGAATSALLRTSSSGTWPAPISRSTLRTASICCSASGEPASTTCSRRSASTTSSSVELERLDQLVREALHEPDGVGGEHGLAPGEAQLAGGGVEGGEEAVLDQHVGVGEAVEQRGLARVGVADERDGGAGAAPTALALRVAVLGQPVEVALEPRDARLDAPAVDLELRLTGTTVADQPAARTATGTLLAELLAPAAQAREPVAELGQLHLHHALLALGVLGEDVEDQRDAVDHVDREQLLEVALLRGRELVVEHDEVDVERVGELLQLLGLARADVGRGVGRVASLQHELDRIRAGGVDEQRELLERRLARPRRRACRCPCPRAGRAGAGRRDRPRSR